MPYKDKKKQEEYNKTYLESHREIAAERSRKHYQANKEQHKKNSVKRRRKWEEWAKINNPKLLMMRRTKNSATARKIECTITVDDFEIPNVCPILLLPLKMNPGNPKKDSPSIDRIDNSKGYVPGNVKVISYSANRMKSSMSKEDIERLWKYVSNP